MELQKKNHKKVKYMKSFYKEPTIKRCLLILHLKVKGKHSIGREF